MSDFGTELGNSGMSAMTKAGEAVLKAMAKIFDIILEKTSAEHKLKKAQLKEIEQGVKLNKQKTKYEGAVGYVEHKKLEQAGVQLTSLGVKLNEKDFIRLAQQCKREGILISGVEDVRDRELAGKKMFTLECKATDFVQVKSILDMINDEKRIETNAEKIEALTGENKAIKAEMASLESLEKPTEEQTQRLDELRAKYNVNEKVIEGCKKDIARVRYGHAEELNEEQEVGIIEEAVYDETDRGVSFDKALDRYTGGVIDKDSTAYIVDIQNPDKYIVCNSSNYEYKGKNRIGTDYEVHNGEDVVYSTNDRMFENRPKDYWKNEKISIKEKGGFGDTVLKFNDKEQFEQFRKTLSEQNKEELDFNVGETGRNYDEIISQLNDKLKECGAEYKDGKATIETGELMMLHEGLDEREQANVAEAIVIVKQIDNYQKLKRLETEINVAKVEVMTADKGSPEHEKATEKLESLKEQLDGELGKEKDLVEQRVSVNAVQSLQEVREAVEQSLEEKNELGENEKQGERTLESYQKEIKERKESKEAENRKHDSNVDKETPNNRGISNKDNQEH